MKVILLEKVRNLGGVGDMVKVNPGYGRNYLVPQGKAIFANEENIAAFEARRAELEKVENEKLKAAKSRGEKLEALENFTMSVRASAEGKLYGSIGPAMIADAMTEAGLEVSRSEVELPTGGAIRLVGEYDINVVLHSDVIVPVHLVVQSEVA